MEVAALGLKVEGVSSIDQATKSLDNFTNASEKAEKSTDGLSKSTKGGSSSFQQMAAVAGRLAGILGGALLSGGLIRLADTWSDLSSRVRVVIGETGNVADVMRQLSDVARTTYSSLESTADSFAKNAFTLNALGKSTQEQIDFTAALNNALVVSGAKGAQFDMVQNSLNRAMAEGTLRGQELQNVLNYGSEVAQSLATELGVNVTELRALAAEGKITGEVIYQSLIKRQEELHNLAETMPATVGDAFTLLRNAVLQTVGVFDQQNSISETLATTLIAVADNMRVVAVILASATAGWVTYQVAVNGVAVALRVAAAAQALFNAAAMANPYVAAASAVVALSVALYGLRNNTIGAGEDAATLGDYFAATWDRVKQGTSGLVDYVSAAWTEFKQATGGLVDSVSSSFSWLWEELKISAHVTINDTIGIIVSLDDTIRLVVKAMYEQFKSGFQNIAALAKAFGQGVAAVFRGDFGFDAFRKALTDKVGAPAKNTAKEIRDAWKKNLGKDWLGDAAASVIGFGREISETAKSSRKLQNDLDELIDSSGLFFGVMEAGGSVVSGTNDELGELSKTLQSLVDKYDKLGAKQRAATADLAGLLKAVELGLPGAEVAIEAFYESLMVADDALKRATESAKENAAEADPLAQSWQEALNRIDSAFVDLWKSAFDNFKGFADSLKNAFIQLLAELAHRATTQKILVGLGFTAGSGGAMAGGASQSAGILSGITTAASNLGGGILGVLSGIGKTIPALQGAVSGLSSILVSTGTKIAGLFGATGLSANIAALVGTGGIGAAIAGITAIVSRLSASWETTRGGIRLGFEGGEFSPDEWIRQTKKSLGGTKRRYRFSDLDPEIAAALNETYGSIVSEAQSAFALLGADLAEEFFESIQIGEVLIGTSGKSKQTEEEIQRQIEQWFAQLQDAMIQGALNAAGDQSAALRLLKASGGGQIMLQALGNLLSVAGVNAVQMARDSHVQLTISEGYDRISQSTRQLIAEYDGSVEATNALTEAMALQQEAAFQVASAFLQAKDAAAQLFGNLRESIRTSLMGQEELYEYRRSQVHSLTDLISTLTDPEAILRASQQIEQTVSALWSSLDETQRKLLGDEYLEYLDRTEQLVMDRLNKGLEEVETTQADIFSALTDQMGTIADRMIEATQAMQAAAELNYLAAQNFNASVGLLMSGFNGGGYYMQEQNA